MKTLKRSMAMLMAVLMMAVAFTACGNDENTKTDSTEQVTTVATTAPVEETVAQAEETTAPVAETEAQVAETEADTENASYVGDYFVSGETDVTVSIKGTFEENNAFEIITTDDNFKSVVSGQFKFGVTASADEIKLILYPHKTVTEADGETTVDDDMSEIEPGYATIVGDELTLETEGTTTVLTRK